MTFGDRRSPLKRTPLKRGTSQLKRTEMKRSIVPLPKIGRKAKADRSALAKSKKVVEKRSGGRCEFRVHSVCSQIAVHFHHRQTGHSNHSPENLAHVCHECHSFAHLNPMTAYERGWLVKHPTDPATVPVKVIL